ncbi:MAG: L,D-transpeptidase family protein [Gammaproteobacteria bacterium]|nr:hypothetical protein [Chromatiales bacterium]MCP4925897.1 L,D-transpeptidase family protein [Gammaproteobacteria bacterium]
MIVAATIWRLVSGTIFLSLITANLVAATGLSPNKGDDLIGSPGHVTAVYADTLIDIARVHKLGYEEIRLANPGVDAWLPGEGTDIRLPTQFILPNAGRTGIVLNIAEYRMYYYFEINGDKQVRTFPISIGRMDWETPLGHASIVKKLKNPSWYPPQSIRDEWAADGRKLEAYVPPGANNPLGNHALRLSIPGYLIHGTNRPAGVGMRVTHGCIRMFPEDIKWLFAQVSVNTPVQIVNQPFKMGWSGDDLYLEVHPPLAEGGASEEAADGEIVPQSRDQATDAADGWSLTDITELYIQITRDRSAIVDWELVDTVFESRLGIPVRVGTFAGYQPLDMQSVLTD